jgi:GAF domain-containing protein
MVTMNAARARMLVVVVLALSLIVLALQVISVRPFLWPAGAGATVSGDTVFASLAEPQAVPRIRPPHLSASGPEAVAVTRVAPQSAAARAGLTEGMAVTAPETVSEALLLWRQRYRRGPAAPDALEANGQPFIWNPKAAWQVEAETRGEWMRTHLGAILQLAAFLAGASILVALGAHGTTATLMTLAMIFTAIANSGPLLGAEFQLPLIAAIVLMFEWLATAVSFPIIGLAVLHFPSRAPVLARYPWITVILPLLPLPVLIVSAVSAAFLLGADLALGPLAWLAQNGWLFDASFALALAANVGIVIEGIHRYRTIVDATERRRIQIVVYTGVPAVFAYAIKAGVPLVTTLAGQPSQLPWVVEGLLQAIVLLPAFALPYAVAVKRIFSPRTVLRRSLQYALARRTLSVLILLPSMALVISLVSQRDRALGEIIVGQPLFYAVSLAFLVLGLRYRDQAQRALDKRFFRAEYDAREILVALANRVPFEQDPTRLVAAIIRDIDNALHPESVALLAGDESSFEVLSATSTGIAGLSRDSGIATLLRWSDQPLDVFLDDDRSPAARLPAPDRAWISDSGAALLVPIFAAGPAESDRALIGVLVLGQKKSEEPYTPEDRKLLSGIAAQTSVALDLSRLRKRASSSGVAMSTTTPTLTPRMIADTAVTGSPPLMMCPGCHRCFNGLDLPRRDGAATCPVDATVLQPVVGMPAIVDGKYRVDAVIGRGGMGAVFRAHDLRLQRDVAVKIVRADLVGSEESQERFQREAQIVARLQHPAIVTIFDFGTLIDGAAFLVMEYIHGEDLRHRLKREHTLSTSSTVHLMTGIAAGVDAAHRAGVLHRDLKPENILLPASGAGPKVLDFGVAKLHDTTTPASRQMTHAGTIVGTPAYMAPEQLRGDVIDTRADVFSLAVMSFEALTGRLPFGSGSFIELALKQAEGTRAIDFADTSAGVARVLARALSLNRDERPATAAKFAEELRLLL